MTLAVTRVAPSALAWLDHHHAIGLPDDMAEPSPTPSETSRLSRAEALLPRCELLEDFAWKIAGRASPTPEDTDRMIVARASARCLRKEIIALTSGIKFQ